MPDYLRAEGASLVVGTITSLPSFLAMPSARTAETTKATPSETQTGGAVSVDTALADYKKDVIASRDDVAAAKSALDLFIAVAKQVRSLLLDARDQAQRAADPATPDAARAAQDVSFKGLVQQLGQLVDGAVAQGATALAGAGISVDADPDAAQALEIPGIDLRVKATSDDGDGGLRLTSASTIATADDARAALKGADDTIARLDAGLRRVEAGAARLDGHDKLLSALDSALGSRVRPDLDADAARLLALQVRQDLTRGAAPIANAAPSAVLALFRE